MGQNRTEIQRWVRRRELRQRKTGIQTWAIALFCNPLSICINTQIRTDAASSDRIGPELKRTPLQCRWPWATQGRATTLRAGASSSDRIGQKFKRRRAPSSATRVGQTRNTNPVACVVSPWSSDRIGQKYGNGGGCLELGQNRTEIQRWVRRREVRQRKTGIQTWASALFCNPLSICINTHTRPDAASSDRIGQQLKRTPLHCRWSWATQAELQHCGRVPRVRTE